MRISSQPPWWAKSGNDSSATNAVPASFILWSVGQYGADLLSRFGLCSAGTVRLSPVRERSRCPKP